MTSKRFGEIVKTQTLKDNYIINYVKRYITSMKKEPIATILGTLSFIFILWLVASFFDVNLHNRPFQSHGYGDFAPWNAFVLFFNS